MPTATTQKKDGETWELYLRVARIVECEPHADSERLYVCKVAVGEPTPRTLVGALREQYARDELLGRRVVCVCNLAPASLVGIESQAMMLVGEKKKASELLGLACDDLDAGARITPNGLNYTIPAAPLDRKGFQTASKAVDCDSRARRQVAASTYLVEHLVY